MILKYITRIFYAVLAALGLMLVFYISDARARKDYLAETGAIALAEGRYEALLPGGYHVDEPLIDQEITIASKAFRMIVYEVGFFRSVTDSAYQAEEGMTILLHQLEGDALEEMFDVVILTAASVEHRYIGYHVAPLDLYSVLKQDSGDSIIMASDFPDDTVITSIVIMDDIDGKIVHATITLNLFLTDLTIRERLENEADTNGTIPTESFGDVVVIPRVRIDTSKAVLIGILIYIGAILGLTYLLFYYQKRRLGKNTPTEGVMKEIEKMRIDQNRKK